MVDKKGSKGKLTDKSDAETGKSDAGGTTDGGGTRRRKVGKAMTVDDLEKLILHEKQKKQSVFQRKRQSSLEHSGSQQSSPKSDRGEKKGTSLQPTRAKKGNTEKLPTEKPAESMESKRNVGDRGITFTQHSNPVILNIRE